VRHIAQVLDWSLGNYHGANGLTVDKRVALVADAAGARRNKPPPRGGRSIKHLIDRTNLGHRCAQHAPAKPRAVHLFLSPPSKHLGKPANGSPGCELQLSTSGNPRILQGRGMF
jgi:hypothetical protein